MFSLTRTEFPDRLLDRDDLDDIAALWRSWARSDQEHEVEQLRESSACGCGVAAQQDVADFAYASWKNVLGRRAASMARSCWTIRNT